MIKVMIADDEDRVCRLIQSLVDWAAFGMNVEGVANNGVEALELVKSIKPDIIITDIRMPGLDGLELIQAAKEIKKDLEFVIISGYRHFEYAQSAIKFGVSDYISKPINKKELMNTLDGLKKKILERKKQLSLEEREFIRMKGDIDVLRASFMQSLVAGKEGLLGPLQHEKMNAEYSYEFDNGCYQAVIIKMDYDYNTYADEAAMFIKNIRSIVKDALGDCCYDTELLIEDSLCYVILNYHEKARNMVRKQLKSCLEELNIRKNMLDTLQVTMCLGPVEEDIFGLFSSLENARLNMYERLLPAQGIFIEDRAQKQSSMVRDNELLAVFTKEAEAALEFLGRKEIQNALHTLSAGLKEKSGSTGYCIYNTVLEAYNLYLILLAPYQHGQWDIKSHYDKFSNEAFYRGRLDDLFQLLEKHALDALDQIIEEQEQSESKPIRLAKKYIQENYRQPLTLEKVASVVGFNASYLSSLFKKESGVNFQDYIADVRIKKAKELLKETDLSIASVCQEIGYNDVKHFTKKFKKSTRLSPNEYRKIYA